MRSTEHPRHVVHVIAGLGLGGAERMLTNLVTFPRDFAPKQTVINLMGDGYFGLSIRKKGIALKTLGLTRPHQALAGVLSLARLFRTLQPSAIQSWMYNADLMAYWAWRWSRMYRSVPLYWGVRCSDMDLSRYPRRLALTVSACARRSRHLSGIVANSQASVAAHRNLGYDERRMIIIENGIDINKFKPDAEQAFSVRPALDLQPKDQIVLHVARVDPMKDHGLLLKIAAARPNLQFLAIGKGTKALEGPSNLRGLGPQIDLTGFYNAANAVILTSAFGEGFPNVLGEAMACGVPVVSTDVGDAKRLVGNCGRIVPTGEPEAFVQALDQVLENPGKLRDSRQRICDYFALDHAVSRFDRLHLQGDLVPLQKPDQCVV